MNNEEAISTIAYELKEGRATNELVFETLDGFNPVLNSSLAQKNVEEANAFYGFMFDIVLSIKDVLVNLKDDLIGNKLQDEENRREMVDALARLGEDRQSGPPPLPGTQDEEAGPIAQGVTAGIAAAITSKIGALIPNSVKTMFLPITSFIATIVKFGKLAGVFAKQLVKFAGPIGIAISIITAIVGAIQGGIKGFKEDGIAGAIKGAVIGAVDLLIGSLVKGISNAIGWILGAIGMKESGGMFGPIIAKIFDGLYQWFGGIVDVFGGIFTLDAKKTIGGVKKILSSVFDIFGNIGSLLITLVKEAIPLIGKVLKGLFWDLPIFIGELVHGLLNWMTYELPGLIEIAVGKLGVFISELFFEFEKQLLPWITSLRDEFLGLIGFVGDKISGFIQGIGALFGKAMEVSGVGEALTDVADFGQMIIDKVVGFVTGVIDAIGNFFANPGESIAGIAESITAWRDDLYKKILRSILPERTGDTAWTDPKHWVAKAIPDSVYEFAGMPTEEGKGLNDSTGGVNPFDKQAKAMAAGYDNWDAYKESGWKWKGPSMQSSPSTAGQTLSDSSAMPSSAPVIINNMGGNVTNMSTSNVNNNTTNMDPILTGSALGLSNF